MGEVALPDAARADEQLVNRSGDRLGERQARDERERFDDEKQQPDDPEQEQERLTDGASAAGPLFTRNLRPDFTDTQSDLGCHLAGVASRPVANIDIRHLFEPPARSFRSRPGAICIGAPVECFHFARAAGIFHHADMT